VTGKVFDKKPGAEGDLFVKTPGAEVAHDVLIDVRQIDLFQTQGTIPGQPFDAHQIQQLIEHVRCAINAQPERLERVLQFSVIACRTCQLRLCPHACQRPAHLVGRHRGELAFYRQGMTDARKQGIDRP
jgi:hypothetical protein